MRGRVAGALCVVVLVALDQHAGAQRNGTRRPNLQGVWNGSTSTPLERPPAFRDRATFTPAEADEYLRGAPDRIRSRLPSEADRATQVDVDDTFVEIEAMPIDRLRTSLVVDPPNGVLPPLVPAVQARIAARPKRSFDDPEVLGLSERCLLGSFGPGGSTASPPMVPSPVFPTYYQIIQSDANVMIFTEWIHDVRIIRMAATHLPPTIRT